ncbi:MAG TPA: winged helix-turn-helix transcriptional regulator, partial [Pseudonocardiaceae bacterium]|nr:winged helix-turn-helix transcriptional regulator [Pseudonocardiaceae bacterium]
MHERNYRQYCGLAAALDAVGERWTLLVVRELLLGPRRYNELLADLPGMG